MQRLATLWRRRWLVERDDNARLVTPDKSGFSRGSLRRMPTSSDKTAPAFIFEALTI